MKTIRTELLTSESFAEFGDVVSAGMKTGSSANQGTAVRFDWSAALENKREGAKPNLAVFRAAPQSLPFSVKLLERHPHSTQAFLPMLCSEFLIIVAPSLPDGAPDIDNVHAFVGRSAQGINYRVGVWHHPIVAINDAAEFAMLAWEDRSAADCEELRLASPIEVSL